MTSIPSSLCTLSVPVPRRQSPQEIRERRLRQQGYDLTTCPTCGQTATRETCQVTRGGRTMRQVVLRCWGKADAGLVPGSARCAPVVSDPRDCQRCGSPLEVGAHINRRYCTPCRETLKGMTGPQRQRVLQQSVNATIDCPCGCGRPVRPGNIYHTHGCARRVGRQERAAPSSGPPRPYVCETCGAEEVHQGRGNLPRWCPHCRVTRHVEQRRRARSAHGPLVRTGVCVGCGAEVRQEGRGGMPRRCPACAREMKLEQQRGYARRRHQARRRSA